MPDQAAPRAYRAVLWLYPSEFRREYGQDMQATFVDIAHDRGLWAAISRVALDTVVTLPRYHLEAIMNPTRAHITVTMFYILIAGTGAALLAGGLYPAAVVLVAGLGLAVSQGSALARALAPSRPTARRRLGAAVACAGLGVLTLIVGIVDLGGRATWPASRLVVYNLIFLVSLIGAISFLASGLAGRRSEPAS